MPTIHYLRIWLACVRYSLVRMMMFRADFIMWSLVEVFWVMVNLMLIGVIYRHTDSIAGWGPYEMLLLFGTSRLLQGMLMGFFWSSLFEMGRNIRTGQFDFTLAQPGNPLFMAATRKLDMDSVVNVIASAGIVVYAVHKLGLHPGALDLALYAALLGSGLVIHFATLLLITSATFWLIGTQGIEGSYFTLFDFARLPREAFRGVASLFFVYGLPAVIASNIPASALLHGFNLTHALWLALTAAGWLALAIFVFNRGLKRYSSASS